MPLGTLKGTMDKEQMEKRRAVLVEALAKVEEEIKNLQAAVVDRVNRSNAIKGGIAEWDKALAELATEDPPSKDEDGNN